MDVRAVSSVSRPEDFSGTFCSACSHECFVVGVTVAYFSAVDHVYVKGDACVVSGCATVRSSSDRGDSVFVSLCVSEVEHGLKHL